jgi:hypothetical protein
MNCLLRVGGWCNVAVGSTKGGVCLTAATRAHSALHCTLSHIRAVSTQINGMHMHCTVCGTVQGTAAEQQQMMYILLMHAAAGTAADHVAAAMCFAGACLADYCVPVL